jgi:pimeloyl-ACP methyl ester carboxylesterase
MVTKRMVLAASVVVLLTSVVFGEDAFFTSRGVKLHYTIQGEGEPVILIHGFGANIEFEWVQSGVLPALAQNYMVIALDNCGHGQSDKPESREEYGLKLVDDVIATMDHLKLEKTHVVGYSMGGMIVEKLMTTHPDRLVTVTIGGAGWTGARGKSALVEPLALSLEQGKGARPLWLYLTPKGAAPPSEEQIQSLDQGFLSVNKPKALAACLRSLETLKVSEDNLRANRVPTLVLIGDKDPIKDDVALFDGVLSNARIVFIPGATHGTAISSPAFISSVKSFLAEHPVGSATGHRQNETRR